MMQFDSQSNLPLKSTKSESAKMIKYFNLNLKDIMKNQSSVNSNHEPNIAETNNFQETSTKLRESTRDSDYLLSSSRGNLSARCSSSRTKDFS